jgi:hypothetical protein
MKLHPLLYCQYETVYLVLGTVCVFVRAETVVLFMILYIIVYKYADPSGRGLRRRSTAACFVGFVGSNPAEGMDVCLLCCPV